MIIGGFGLVGAIFMHLKKSQTVDITTTKPVTVNPKTESEIMNENGGEGYSEKLRF